MFALDFATQAQQMKAIGGQPDYALGSVQWSQFVMASRHRLKGRLS